MADNAVAARRSACATILMSNPLLNAGKGLLAALAQNACVVVTDDFPCFFLPRMVAAAAKKLSVLLEAVDSNGLLPVRATEQTFLRAFDFRRLLQKELPQYFARFPHPNPLAKAKLPPAPAVPRKITSRWAAAGKALLADEPGSLDALPIDHSVEPTPLRGGHTNARDHLLSSSARIFHAMPNSATTPNTMSPAAFRHSSILAIFPSMKFSRNWLVAKSGSRRKSLCAPTAAARAGGT